MVGIKTTDFNDKKLKSYIEFEGCEQLTVGELKKRLEAFSDSVLVLSNIQMPCIQLIQNLPKKLWIRILAKGYIGIKKKH